MDSTRSPPALRRVRFELEFDPVDRPVPGHLQVPDQVGQTLDLTGQDQALFPLLLADLYPRPGVAAVERHRLLELLRLILPEDSSRNLQNRLDIGTNYGIQKKS